ncbi:hypothetical protein Ahy_B09g099260 [Arachis hypogaea]|uniref:Aminotransferase-like plant mobile domain-containing protein n=1 Tax=Arachis hypogaea TaxID=3818 RepID=A0A444XTE7_ARAHY|nr:hypothetical protein Ahy_B09g099260 [Arachis hypogaea]
MKESFSIKIPWLRDRVWHMPAAADPATLRQCTRCYIMLLIGSYLMTDKSNTQVHIRWLSLLDNFGRCSGLSWGSTVLAWTYHSLCLAAHRDTTNIARCISLLWCPPEADPNFFPSSEVCPSRVGTTIYREFSDGGRFDFIYLSYFLWTPYHDPTLQAITLDWLRAEVEWGTWMSIAPLVYFNIVEFHHADRVKHQFGGKQPVFEDSVNVDRFLTSTRQREDVWVLFKEGHRITIQPFTDDRPTLEYWAWYQQACWVRHLFGKDVLDDPKLLTLPDDDSTY